VQTLDDELLVTALGIDRGIDMDRVEKDGVEPGYE
jgi:hypothetical protein